MHCPYCNTINDNENSFCVSCGKTISQNLKTQTNILPPTQAYQTGQSSEPDSVKTAYPPKQAINQAVSKQEETKKSSKTLLFAALGVGFLILLGGIGTGGYYFWQQQTQSSPTQKSETLPDHLGIFVQNIDKTAVDEIKQDDISNAFEAKERLLENDSLPVWEENASLILYFDAKDIPITDLKLVQLDTIEEDGNLKQIDFQASPIEEKPEMKRLRFPDGIADGKYVFALFKGFLDEGNHKFWAFQVKNSTKSDNADIAKSTSVSVKDTEKSVNKEAKETEKTEKTDTPTPVKEKKVSPPSGARVAYCNGSNVLLRALPSLQGKKVGKLSRGQRIYIMYYSENYDEWRGTTANWAYIQTESGGRGWVFTPFVYY